MRSTIGCAHYVMQLAMECQLKGHNYEQRLMMSDLLWVESMWQVSLFCPP